MSTAFQVDEFHWIKYEGNWTIAQCIHVSGEEPEEEGAFNRWIRLGASGWNYQYNFDEIDPNPIKREA